MEQIKKIRSYAILINKSIFWSHYFDVMEKAPPVAIGCQNAQISQSDEKMTSTFRHFVSTSTLASQYYRVKEGEVLTQTERDVSRRSPALTPRAFSRTGGRPWAH